MPTIARFKGRIQLPPWWYAGFVAPIALGPLMGPRGTIWVAAFAQPQIVNTLGYTTYYLAVPLTIFVLLRYFRLKPMVTTRRSLVLTGLGSTVGILLFALSGLRLLDDWWFLVGLGIVGASQAVLMLAWGDVYRTLDAGQMRISHSGSFVVAAGFIALLNAIGRAFPLLAVLALICLPWFSLGALVAARKSKLHDRRRSPRAEVNTFRMPLKVLVGIASYGLFFGFMVRMTVSPTQPTPITVALNYGLFFAIALSVFGMALFSEKLGRPGLMYRPVLPLIVVGFLLLPILGRSYLAGAVAAAGMAYFRIFWLAIAIDIARGVPAPLLRTQGWALIADYGGVALGSSLQDILSFNVALSTSQLTVISSAAVVALILISMFMFNERGFDDLWGALPSVPEPEGLRLEKRCSEVAAAYGLTPREEEILVFLARGRNREYIQKTLVLSKYTVRTHIQRIYEKLDVHSHQDLIDLVEGCDVASTAQHH
ncbi:MAG: response regulator transcription factor [Coriobacteriia bacterium]